MSIFSKLKKHKGESVQIHIDNDSGTTINITGILDQVNDQYRLTPDEKVNSHYVFEEKKVGSPFTWKGSHKEYVIKHVEAGEVQAQFKLNKRNNIILTKKDKKK